MPIPTSPINPRIFDMTNPPFDRRRLPCGHPLVVLILKKHRSRTKGDIRTSRAKKRVLGFSPNP
jgi:hypothetical protein